MTVYKKKIKIDFDKIKNLKPKKYKSSSVALTQEQIDFIRDKEINLSKLVRSILEDIMSDWIKYKE